MANISVVINTLNEEENLPRALASVKGFADEVVVVDMKSDDKTAEVAKRAGAKVYEHERTGYVEPARNYAIDKATHEWILILDADEEVPKSLAEKLVKISSNRDPSTSLRMTSKKNASIADYYRIPRKNFIFGKWIKHSRWWPDYNIRFFKKGFVSWSEIIHSVPITKGNGADIKVKEANAIVHLHYQTIEQYLTRLNRYTTEHTKLLVKGNYKFNWTDLIKKPSSEFLSRYFQGEGYKDGIQGLALAGLQAFSEFIIYLKVWQTEKFKDEDVGLGEIVKLMKKEQKNVNYWIANSLINEGGGIKNRVKRKLKI